MCVGLRRCVVMCCGERRGWGGGGVVVQRRATGDREPSAHRPARQGRACHPRAVRRRDDGSHGGAGIARAHLQAHPPRAAAHGPRRQGGGGGYVRCGRQRAACPFQSLFISFPQSLSRPRPLVSPRARARSLPICLPPCTSTRFHASRPPYHVLLHPRQVWTWTALRFRCSRR